MINIFDIFNKILLTESVSEDKVINALKKRERIIISYESNVPGYVIADGVRYIDPYCLGIGRYMGEMCLRAYQPFGDTASKVPNWKIFYLKDITMWKPTGYINKEVAPKFNQSGDRWMESVIYIANYRKFGSRGQEDDTLYKTDTEKQIDKLRQEPEKPKRIDVSQYSKTTQERYKEMKSIANKALALYNKARRGGNMEEAERALNAFREVQALANRYMSIYKKELGKN